MMISAVDFLLPRRRLIRMTIDRVLFKLYEDIKPITII